MTGGDLPERVLVTGGSGVVGAAVLRHLVSSGVTPRALVRSATAAATVAALGAEPVPGDLLDERSLRSAVAGCDLVFHVAGLNMLCPPDPSLLTRVNVDGALSVARAAREAGVRRLVHTSSAAAIGEAKGTIGSEDSPHRGRYLSAYERSKHLGEEALLSEAGGGGTEVVVVNPSSVQGPGRATGTGGMILDLLRGRLPVLVDTRISVVDIDDCARGHLLAATRGQTGRRYLLNSFTLPVQEAVAMLERVAGRRIQVRYLPGWMAAAGAAAVEAGSGLVGRRPPVCREMVRALLHGHAYDGSRAERELGLTYSSPRSLLSRLVEWFRSEGLLDGSRSTILRP